VTAKGYPLVTAVASTGILFDIMSTMVRKWVG